MNNILIYSDLHINQSSLKECIQVLEEIGMLANKYNVDTLINCGDTFDGLKPSSQEMDVFATFIRRLGNDRQHIILAADSHESETKEISILNHYGILSDNVKIVKEFKDDNHLYCGHMSIKESSKNYDAKLSKIALKDFIYVFLGHVHSYEIIKPNICHLGSSRYVNFDEAKDNHKVVALIENYGTDKEEVHFLGLKSPTSMVEFLLNSNNNNNLQEKNLKNTPKEALQDTNIAKKQDMGKATLEPKAMISEGENPPNSSQIEALCQKLDKLDKNTKVKVKIMDFESFKAFLPFESKYKEKFEKFVRENDFELISDKRVDRAKSEIDLKESFNEFAKEKQIDSEIKEIINKEIKC